MSDIGETLATPVDYRVDQQGVAVVTLNRPDRLNAVNAELTSALVSALRRAAASEVRVVVIRGAGRSFCAGHDLNEDPTYSFATADSLQEVTRAIRATTAPVIATVQGYALGAGFEFALAADLVVAAESAVFGFPEVDVGLSHTGGVTALLPRLIGPLRAKQLMFLGERLGAQDACQLGLVNWVVKDEELQKHVDDVCHRLCEKPAIALQLSKQALDLGLESGLDSQLALEVTHLLLASASPEAAAVSASFRARRARGTPTDEDKGPGS